MTFRLQDRNTRFALPIICPKTGEDVSAELLYNRCCDALGHIVKDHIGDLILDNLQYPDTEVGQVKFYDDAALCEAIYAWADKVREQLAAAAPTIETLLTSYLAVSTPGKASDCWTA